MEKNIFMCVKKEGNMIGIICAMRSEIDEIIKYMNPIEETSIYQMQVYVGKIHGKDVVVALSGVGKVNAAISTTLLLSTYPIHKMLNIGVAGGICQTVDIFDIIVSDKVIEHDYDTSALDGEEGLGLHFSSDVQMRETFESIIKKYDYSYHVGTIASGDVFVTKEKGLEEIISKFPDSLCAEMEAGAIAHVCAKFEVPFLMIRSLSDVAYKEENSMDFMTFVKGAANKAAELCNAFIEII